MANEPVVTLIGNISEPELKFVPSGKAVMNFTLFQTPRVKRGDQWEDGETMRVRCAIWGEAAENAAQSLQKGSRVMVIGRMSVRKWTKDDGTEQESLELQVDEVAASMRYATLQITKVQGAGATRQDGRRNDRASAPGSAASNDPWAADGASASGEPPF